MREQWRGMYTVWYCRHYTILPVINKTASYKYEVQVGLTKGMELRTIKHTKLTLIKPFLDLAAIFFLFLRLAYPV